MSLVIRNLGCPLGALFSLVHFFIGLWSHNPLQLQEIFGRCFGEFFCELRRLQTHECDIIGVGINPCIDMDLSRFSATLSARLCHLEFEGDRAFPAQ